MNEAFRPRAHLPPDSLRRRVVFASRTLADLQVSTVYADVRHFAATSSGTIVDIGAGAGPYRHAFAKAGLGYVAIDIEDATRFGYANRDAVSFDGLRMPFEDESVDGFICTEVLEHVENPAALVDEMHRILRPGGRGLVTLPWSARFHYQPNDFQRLTPTALARLFSRFPNVDIRPRGTDITVIAAKSIVVWARLAFPTPPRRIRPSMLLALATTPLLAACVVAGHASIALHAGSDDDPLGYSVWLTK
jgi:SAM-dependent methyltransferase